MQKVLVGREMASSPIVLMTAYAVRGLDINTSYTIYTCSTSRRRKAWPSFMWARTWTCCWSCATASLVLCGGKVNGIVDARKTTKEEVGLR